jgi:ATP-binding cassette subfamily B protein
LVETTGIVLIAIFAYTAAIQSNEGFVTLVPVFGALVLGAQRILPVLQQVYSSWTSIQSNRVATEDVINLLSQSNKTLLSSNELLKFEQSIKFCNVSFRYGLNDPWILYKINFTIKKGQFIGIKGETGSGKSTLIDILMGLIQPTKGHIEIDGLVLNESNSRSWQKKISHVPQKIFLSDCSILENIAFGVPRNRIDLERVKDAVQRAQFNTTVDGFKDGYETIVGERGAKLSGGQLQRVGISRALYKNTDFLVFDEATSALDDQTELKLMGELLSSRAGVTIVMITHRPNALVDCHKIIEIKNGHII